MGILTSILSTTRMFPYTHLLTAPLKSIVILVELHRMLISGVFISPTQLTIEELINWIVSIVETKYARGVFAFGIAV